MNLSRDDIDYILWALIRLRVQVADELDWVEREELDNLIQRFDSE